MDVEFINKYKPTDLTDNAMSAKKRKSDSVGSKDENPPPNTEGKNDASKGGRGNKGTGRGHKGGGRGTGASRGWGKGRNEGSGGGEPTFDNESTGSTRRDDRVEYSNREIIATNSKLIARLCQDRREQMRHIQYVVRIPSGDNVIRGLFAAQKQWKDSRPTVGRHQDGELHEVCWRILVYMLTERLGSSVCITAEQKHNITALKKYLQLTIEEPGKALTPGTRPTSVIKFQPAGKASRGPPPDGKEWVWVLRFASDRQKAREAHEETAYVAPLFKDMFGISIANDTGPRDSLEFELERQLSSLRV